MSRDFTYLPAARARVPLIIALSGPSGSGKTYSALRLAAGMQAVMGGDIAGVDTESGRMLHYSFDERTGQGFKFHHIPFVAPYSPGDYMEAIDFALGRKPTILVIDQFTYEHDGEGGVLEMHDAELTRMAGDNWGKRQACNQAAWIKPKAMRKKLINKLVAIGASCAIILLFRAKETVKQVKKADGKTEMVPQGITPIGGAEYIFEATASIILPPAAKGVPSWQTEYKGEQLFMKLPVQFEGLLNGQLTEDTGRKLAEWARGGVAVVEPVAAGVPPAAPDLEALAAVGETKAGEGLTALRGWWSKLPAAVKAALKPTLDTKWKQRAESADAQRTTVTTGAA